LSKPALMSRNRAETSSLRLGRVFTSCLRVRQASEELSPTKETDWLGWRRSFDLATVDSLTVIIRSIIFEMVLRGTMMRKEVGDS